MLAASIYALFQPLNPQPGNTSFWARFWYPYETDPYARLLAVDCDAKTDNYACRLNSVAVNGTGDLPEVWAVGNVGLVLHRPAGQTKWEQLTINAIEENAAPPSPKPTATPKQPRLATQTPTPTPTPVATPIASLPVPSLLGLTLDDARQKADASGFTLHVEYGPGSDPKGQHGPLGDVRVLKQSPDPNTLAPPKSTINILIGVRSKAGASLLDNLIPTVYAAEPESQKKPAAKAPPPQQQQRQPTAFLTVQPSRGVAPLTVTATTGGSSQLGRIVANTFSWGDGGVPVENVTPTMSHVYKNPGRYLIQASVTNDLGVVTNAQPVAITVIAPKTASSASTPPPANAEDISPQIIFPLDDDLIHVTCEQKEGCYVVGRSGRIYKIKDSNSWIFTIARFARSTGALDPPLLTKVQLVSYSFGDNPILIIKSDNTFYRCPQVIVHSPTLVVGLGYIECQNAGTDLVATDDNLLKVSLNGQLFGSIENNSSDRSASPTNRLTGFGSATQAALNSYAFASATQGFIVGDHAVVLSSDDGGKHWRHETQGPDGAAPNHRFPAPWYWLTAALLIGACIVVVAIPAVPPATEISVADWAVTDAPLKPGDPDSLDLTPMALGLSRFIRNPKTQPPITIAIEGEWGQGKSSVMSLLKGDLEKSRFRPVWFNAWHHQSEDQLLAGLLEHIKDQAIPPWWHLDNWIFRGRLFYLRFQGKWPLMIVALIAFIGTIAFELTSHEFSLAHIKEFGHDVYLLLTCLVPGWPDKKLPADFSHFRLIAIVIASFGALLKQVRAFGINPAKLTDNLRDASNIKDVKPDPGIRRQFAREFCDFCQAWSWGSRRVIIFIDDLDRCRPESVVTVLESINFLTTAGDCIVVLGMAEKQVTHCVGLSFKEIAHAEEAYRGGGNTEQENAVACYKYGELYIRKLVNILAPLPKTTAEQRRRVLESRAAEARQQDRQEASVSPAWRTRVWDSLSKSGRLAFKLAPLAAMLLMLAAAIFVGHRWGEIQNAAEAAKSQKAAAATETSSTQGATKDSNNTQGKTGEPAPGSKTVKLFPYKRPTEQQAKLTEPAAEANGGMWRSFVVNAFLLIVLFGMLGYQLSARTNQDAQNSPEFEQSLKLWGQYIAGVCDTPREIKRALNDLRYQAMTRRSNGPSITRGERFIRTMRQLVTGKREEQPAEIRVNEAALPPRKAAELAGLTEQEWRFFLDPRVEYTGFTDSGFPKSGTAYSETLNRLVDLKAKHIAQFGEWMGVKIETPESAKSAGQSS